MIDGGIDVEERLVKTDLGGDLHAAGAVGGIVVELDAGLNAIEEAGSDGDESLGGVVVGDGADVAIHPEDFLKDDDGERRGGGGFSEIGTEAMAVGGRELQMGAHEGSLPFLDWREQLEEGDAETAQKKRGLRELPSAQREHP